MAHTPGPWRTEKQEDSDAYWVFAGTKNRQTEVADVWSTDSRTDPLPSRENAHLMAAAPDMLTVLEAIIRHYSDYLDDTINREARTAIAKARSLAIAEGR